MANKNIRGLTVEINGDATKLGDALKGVDQHSKSLNAELKAVNKLLKLDPSNTEALRDKQKLLAEAVENTKEKVNILQAAQEDAKRQLESGDLGREQYYNLQIELKNAEDALRDLEAANADAAFAASHAADDIQDLGGSAADVSQSMSDAAEQTAEAGDSMERAGDKSVAFADVLKANLLSTTIKKGVGILIDGLKSLESEIPDYIDNTSELYNNAIKIGMSAEDLQKWQYAAVQCGIESGTLVSAMKKQQSVFVKAAKGNEAAMATYEQLGVDIKRLSGPGEAFEQVLFALSGISDEVERDTAANGLFGKSYADLLPLLEEGQGGIANLRDECWQLGGVISNDAVAEGKHFGDELTTIKTRADGLKNKLVQQLMPSLGDLADTLDDALADPAVQESMQELGKELAECAKKLIPAIASAVPKLVDGAKWVAKHMDGIFTTMKLIGGIYATTFAVKKIKDTVKAVKGLYNGFNDLRKSGELASKVFSGSLIGALGALGLMVINSIKNTRAAKDEWLKAQQELIDGGKDAVQSAWELGESYKEQAGKIAEAGIGERTYIQKLSDELGKLVDANGKVKKGYEERAEYITGELSAATDVDLKYIDGQVKGYDTLREELGDILTLKQANSMLSAGESVYNSAVEAVNGTEMGSQAFYEQANTAYNNFLEQQKLVEQTKAEILELERAYANGEIEWWDMHNQEEALNTEEYREAVKATSENNAEALNLHRQAALFAYETNLEQIRSYESLRDSIDTNDPSTIAGAITAYTQQMLEAGDASVEALALQEQKAKEEYEKLTEQAGKVGSTITGEQIDAAFESKIKTSIETYKAMLRESNQYTEKEIQKQADKIRTALEENGKYTSDEVDKILSSLKKAAYSGGVDYSKGFSEGIKSKHAEVVAAARHQARTVVEAQREELGIHSPSKEAQKIAEYYDEGLVVGIDNGAKEVAARIQQLSALINGTTAQGLQADFARFASPEPIAYNAELAEILSVLRRLNLNLVLDGDTLVAKTAARTDVMLGKRIAAQQRGSLV